MNVDVLARRRLTAALIWLTLAAASVYLLIFEPGRTGFFPACPFRTVTGLACPGCGSTRAMHRLLHGDLVGAFEFNALFVLALPFLLFVLIRYTVAAINNRPFTTNQLNAKYIWMMFVVITSFWVVRNTPLYPFPL